MSTTHPATTAQITKVYSYLADGTWLRISELADHLDVNLPEIKATLREMFRTGAAELAPFDKASWITDWDAECAPIIGGEPKHLIKIH